MFPPFNRFNRRSLIAPSVTICLAALVGGFLVGGLAGEVPPVHAASCQHNGNFPCADGSLTSALEVSHHTSPAYMGTSTVVEPDDGERWAITAQWCPGVFGPEVLETAYVTVSWNGSSWVLSNKSTTTNIFAISICQGDTCDAGGGSVHAWNYKLIVDIVDYYPGTYQNLAQVTYTTTEVDDGSLVMDPTRTQGDCYLGASVSPTSQSFSATDSEAYWGSGRCAFGCGVSGASVTLNYD